MTDQDQDQKLIPIHWDFGDVKSVYATNILVQAGEGDIFIAFFEIRPPIVFSESDRESVASVTAQCVARVVVSPDRMQGLIDAMQRILNDYLSRDSQGDQNHVGTGHEE